MSTVWLVMDGRAYSDPAEANVLVAALTLADARTDRASGAYGIPEHLAIVEATEEFALDGEWYGQLRLVD